MSSRRMNKKETRRILSTLLALVALPLAVDAIPHTRAPERAAAVTFDDLFNLGLVLWRAELSTRWWFSVVRCGPSRPIAVRCTDPSPRRSRIAGHFPAARAASMRP